MGKRGHGGKKRNKKQKASKNVEKCHERKTEELSNKIIVDKAYQGKLRAVTVGHIDVDIDLKEITKHIEYPDGNVYNVFSIERLNRKETSEEGKTLIEPSRTCKITFKGDQIPSKVKLWYAELECKPFWNNVIQCYTCLRFRHLSTTCKGYARCSKCAARKEPQHTCAQQKLCCANCKGEHAATDNSCPVYLLNKQVNLVMARENVDYKTAVKIHGDEKRRDATSTKVISELIADTKTLTLSDLKVELSDMEKMLDSIVKRVRTSIEDKLENVEKKLEKMMAVE